MLLKVELHTHTSDDPEDVIPHSAEQLIDRATVLGFAGLAITLHNRQLAHPPAVAYARQRGITLIPGVERTIANRHVLLINFPGAAERVATFEDLRVLKRQYPRSLIVAPHPLFPLGSSIGSDVLREYADLWDAIEVNAFYTRTVDFNRGARRWARAHGLPLVGNGDVHRLQQLGTTYSMVEVDDEPSADRICDAVRAGRVQVATRPLSHVRALAIATRVLTGDWIPAALQGQRCAGRRRP